MQTQLPGELPVTLPETANFVRQVELNRTLDGVYPLSRFSRLAEILLSDEGNVTVKLEFTRSVGIASLRGKVSANLLVECQRCLEPVEIEVSGSFKFALVHSEDEFDLLPEEFEPYLIEGEEQSIIDLVEDELLLSLPMVLIHDEACSDFMSKQNEEVKAAIKADKEAENPFAALKALKEELSNKAN